MTRSEPPTLDRETACEILSAPCRQYVLSRLKPGERVGVDELARELAAWKRDCSTEDVEPSVRRRITISLVHNHLPRLDDHDIVEYRPRANDVVLTTPVDDERPPVDAIESPIGASR